MKVKSINYQKVFPLAQYVNERIGVEIELDENDNWNENFLLAKRMVDTWHKENNPGLYIENTNTGVASNPHGDLLYPIVPTAAQPIQVDRTIGITVETIMSCEDLAVLDSYRLLVKGKDYLQKAYDFRLNELQSLKNKP